MPPAPSSLVEALKAERRRLAAEKRQLTKTIKAQKAKAKRMILRHKIAGSGDRIVIMAGVPFGQSGSTNVVHVVKIAGDELETYQRKLDLD